ncbi:MAG: Hsp20/alpha crystallin family protein [Candidatus Heimdallarchaeota archaeon]|nr:Hsp20/alpha crystallin family protein [Candidatus Heimdallarchaeota archaeon]
MHENDDLPKDFKEFVNQFINMIQNGDILDKMSRDVVNMGFVVNIGPDGVPHISQYNPESINPQDEDLLYDVLDQKDYYELILEVPGISRKDQIIFTLKDNTMKVVAENETIRYKTKIIFEKPISDDISIDLKNRTAIIKIPIIQL